jgi:hypothetical protein
LACEQGRESGKASFPAVRRIADDDPRVLHLRRFLGLDRHGGAPFPSEVPQPGETLHNPSETTGEASGSPTKPGTHQLRRMLYELADGWRPYTANLRQRQCGRVRINQSIELMRRPDGAHFVGVLRCRSKSCPTCIAVRRAKAADEISRVAELAATAGYFVYMATFTIRHGARMTLERTGHGIRPSGSFARRSRTARTVGTPISTYFSSCQSAQVSMS